MGQNYPLNKRRGGGAWQWALIGFVPGFLCAAAIAIVAVASGTLQSFLEPQVIEVTSEVHIVNVVTATADPNASPAVQIVTTTPEPTTEPVQGSPVFPTETPQVANTAAVVATADSQVAVEVTDTVERPTTDTQSQSITGAGLTIPAELDSIKSALITVAGGNFLMGTTSAEILQAAQDCVNRDGGQCDPVFGEDSLPAVPVNLDTFSIEQTEVSFDQYVAFLNYLKSQGFSHLTGCGGYICIQTANERPDAAVISYDSNNYFIPTRLENLENHPVYGVTWYGAYAYCQALGRRLPTEAEWEYAARSGGQNIPFPWGTNWSNEFANVRIPIVQETGQSTVAVDSNISGRNAIGLYHMAGNVGEWTNDWYNETYYQTLSSQAQASDNGAVDDPQGPPLGTTKSIRGGSFNALPFFARTFHRQAWQPAPEGNSGEFPLWTGFRCVTDGEANNAPASSDSSGSGVQLSPIPLGDNPNNAQPTAPSSPEESATESGSRG
jgi:formylglycine-generating enzyme required for sulfatase activity